MKPIVHHDRENKEKLYIKAESRNEEGRKRIEKVELNTHDMETLKFVERKLADKGVQRMERHPADGLPLKHDPKKGHGGKYSWEGPGREFESELEPVPPAIDEKDPNYVEEKREDVEVSGLVVGEIEIPKASGEGVARIDVDPALEGQFHS